jgi:enamine deaminase RidA (YjgF/YER057c/UK114 family)
MTLTLKLPFSASRRAGGLLFLSGELPLTADGSVPAGIAAQTELALARIEKTLAAEGATLADVVQVTVHLVHPGDFAQFNAVYQDRFTAPYPARTTVIASLVVAAASIEISVVADLARTAH